jgi:DNA helicase-2/ATP-dependent DNA helicase PcrA
LSFAADAYRWSVLFAADLHLHSHFSKAVSPAMTLENIALWAQRKGVDLLGTGDCLQPQWQAEIEAHTEEAEPGLRKLKPETERAVHARLPEGLRRSLRFVMSTEVNCAPPGTDEIAGLHQLLYFPSLDSARAFGSRIAKHGDLQDGRPLLRISAQRLLQGTRNFERVHLAPAHVMNPWFSALGVIGGRLSLEQVYGEQLPHLLAVETGLTSDPAMCRRVPGLDAFGLFSCSDAHSLDNVGRECTVLNVEPCYDAVMSALNAGVAGPLQETLKFPLNLTRYFLSWCGRCKITADARICPECGRAMTMGSRDRLEKLDGVRAEPISLPAQPPFKALKPLAYLVAAVEGRKPETAGVRRDAGEIVDRLGRHERFVLTEAPAEELLTVTKPEMVDAILRQRAGASLVDGPERPSLGQVSLGI